MSTMSGLIWTWTRYSSGPLWMRLRCPHHGDECGGRHCCCRDVHWRPFKFARAMKGVTHD